MPRCRRFRGSACLVARFDGQSQQDSWRKKKPGMQQKKKYRVENEIRINKQIDGQKGRVKGGCHKPEGPAEPAGNVQIRSQPATCNHTGEKKGESNEKDRAGCVKINRFMAIGVGNDLDIGKIEGINRHIDQSATAGRGAAYPSGFVQAAASFQKTTPAILEIFTNKNTLKSPQSVKYDFVLYLIYQNKLKMSINNLKNYEKQQKIKMISNP